MKRYVDHNLISAQALEETASTPEDLKRLVIHTMLQNGKVAMYKAILLNYGFVANVLQTMTLYLEQHPNGQVLFHCSVGKDRTGMIAMLCEAMVGVDHEEIVTDYAKSNETAIPKGLAKELKVNLSAIEGAEPEIMEETLQWIQRDFSSVEEYLDLVGFDSAWRKRFTGVAHTERLEQ